MNVCTRCSLDLGPVEKLRAWNLGKGDPVICQGCGEIMALNEDLSVQALTEHQERELLREFPVLGYLQNEARAESITDGSTCPSCGLEIQQMLQLGDQKEKPTVGTPCYCVACSTILVFTAHGGLRVTTPKEHAHFVTSPAFPEEVRRMLMARGSVEATTTKCPWCGMEISRISSSSYEAPDELPKAGDLTVCDNCGNFMTYIDSDTIRKSTDDERAQILEDNPELQAVLDQITVRRSKGIQA